MKRQIVFLVISISFFGCVSAPDRVPSISDDDIGSQVYACAAGFGTEVATSLKAEYQENIKKGDVGVEATAKTVAAVVELLPKDQFVDGYREYVDCLQIDISVPSNSSKLTQAEAMKLAVDMCSGKNIDPAEYNETITRSAEDVKKLLGDNFNQEAYDKYLNCVSTTYSTLLPPR